MEPQGNQSVQSISSRAWYSAPISIFLTSDPIAVFGALAKNGDFNLLTSQKEAWLVQIRMLQESLIQLNGTLLLEFNIPRMGRRIDAVLLIKNTVFAIEFKVGGNAFDKAAIEQVWDYALDLKNFHRASHNATIIPVLIATNAETRAIPSLEIDADSVYRPVTVTPDTFRPFLDNILISTADKPVIDSQWEHSPYHPTPTIIEAARSLYAQHSVEAIARHDAGAKNLQLTSGRIDEIVDSAMRNRTKVICFVTGVPGAGKTLVGLNVATRHRRELNQPTNAVFLSGNGPLVAVLHEALTRDEVKRRKAIGEKVRKSEVGESVKAFIQNVHHFRDDALIDPEPPFEHVVIFDEAQRAWNLRQTANFMSRKKDRPDFSQSEPEFLISCMERHKDWAVVICLVGGGQEINTGEAGINAWIEAINAKFPHWQMYISPRLTDSEYAADQALNRLTPAVVTHFDESLHLSVSMRSFRAENVSAFVKALLDCERSEARETFRLLSDRFPIVLTRSLERAKHWIKSHARGSERSGLVASSRAQRLKPHAIDVRVNIDPVHWFLNDRNDTRSSYYLEDAATEFQVQGLELDWVCITWDADFRFNNSGWSFHDFRGNRWTNIANAENRNYLRNAYRVLLTRARQGMVIFVPTGDSDDPTRSPAFYDPTFNYLRALGIPSLD